MEEEELLEQKQWKISRKRERERDTDPHFYYYAVSVVSARSFLLLSYSIATAALGCVCVCVILTAVGVYSALPLLPPCLLPPLTRKRLFSQLPATQSAPDAAAVLRRRSSNKACTSAQMPCRNPAHQSPLVDSTGSTGTSTLKEI